MAIKEQKEERNNLDDDGKEQFRKFEKKEKNKINDKIR